jgi:amidohydrolase
MIEDGALDDPAPDVALGMHVWNTAPVGTLGIASGPIMAGSTGFRLKVTGRGGHGAMPQDTIDPVIASAHIITALQSVISRNVSALDTAVLSVCSINGGDAHNIIPSEVTLRGTIRYYDDDIRALIVERVQALSESIAEGFGCETAMKFYASTPPVVNDPDVTGVVLSAGAGVVGEGGIMEERVMGSEDMACYLDRVPGCFFFVGSAPEKDAHAHHHPNFDINEDALPTGAATMCAAIAHYVM